MLGVKKVENRVKILPDMFKNVWCPLYISKKEDMTSKEWFSKDKNSAVLAVKPSLEKLMISVRILLGGICALSRGS